MVELNTDRPEADKERAATAASEAKDWLRAAQLWEELRAEADWKPHYWYRTAEAYCEARKLDDAEKILSAAVARFPDHNWLAHRYILTARRAGDFAAMLERASRLRRAAPDFYPAWLEEADALAALGRAPEADRLRREAAARFSKEFWVHYAIALNEARRGDHAKAVRVWSDLAGRFPRQPAALDALRQARAAAASEQTEVPRMTRMDSPAVEPSGSAASPPQRNDRREELAAREPRIQSKRWFGL